MNKLSKILAICFGFGVLAMFFSLILAHPVKADKPSKIDDVNVTNNPLFVQDRDAPDRQPFASSCYSEFSDTSVAFCEIYVPIGVEWVIQSISIMAQSDAANRNMQINLGVTTKTFPQYHFYNLKDNGLFQNGDPATGMSNLVDTFSSTLRADPGSTIFCRFDTGAYSNPHKHLLGEIWISGYFITLP